MSLFRRKVRDVHAFYAAHPSFAGRAEVIRESATTLAGVADNSVDYVFTDPPFGANIYYADCALLWESWIGEYTDPGDEILIHTKQRLHGGNSLADYERLMAQALTRMREVLKPGAMASVVFHSSHATIWRAIQNAVRAAGFELVDTGALDKGQPSIKGVKGRRGTERVAAVDVILNLRKPSDASLRPTPSSEPELRPLVLQALTTHLASLRTRLHVEQSFVSDEMRRLQHLHSLAVRTILEHGIPFRDVSFAFVEGLCEEHFVRRGEYWYLADESGGCSDERGSQLDLISDVLS